MTPALALLLSRFAIAANTPASLGTTAGADPPTIELGELFALGPAGLSPTEHVARLRGQRVRIVGYMAQMERPPRGAFWLTSRPVVCDESGDGTSDLPLEALLVVVHVAPERVFVPRSRAVEVTGTLELGNQVDEDGRVSMVRLVLDSQIQPRAATPSAQPVAREAGRP